MRTSARMDPLKHRHGVAAAGARRLPGFTIIEVMIAIFIFALIFGAIYSSWLAIVRGAKSGVEAAAAVQRSRRAAATIEEALNCTRAFTASMGYYSFIAENGDSASMSFVAKLPQQSFPRSGRFGSFDVRRLTFSLETTKEGRELVLRQKPILMDWDVDEKEHPFVLAKDIRDFEMLFWDKRAGDWVDEWTQTNEIPAMVVFTLRWGGPTRQTQQEISRLVALPSVAVPPTWQGGAAGARPPPVQVH